MKSKTTAAMLLLAVFVLSSIAIIRIEPVKAASTYTLPDAEMMSADFICENWGGSPVMTKTDVAGPGVQFDLTGLGKAAIMDKYELNPLAGGGGGAGGHYADFTGYCYYYMRFVNLGAGSFNIALYMNTGFTGGGAWRDTFWQSSWTTIGPGESKILMLDFSNVYEAYSISDDLDYPGYSNGVQPPGTAMFRLNEVTNIGFQVEGSGGATTASFITSGTHLYIDEPITNKGPGDVDSFFDVYVTLSGFTNFAGYDIKLTWDNSLITMSAVDYATYSTTLWGTEGSQWNKYYEDLATPGAYQLAVAALATSASNAGASVLFKVTFHIERSCNFPLSTLIHFAVVKLSDNAVPVPNPIIAIITDGTYNMGSTKPDITFKVLKKIPKETGDYLPVAPPYNLEYCDMIKVEVYVSHIHDCSPLEDYDITITYGSELVSLKGVGWGIFGTNSFDNATGAVHVWGNGAPQYGESMLLFTLEFHVEFTATPGHIWKYGNVNHLTFDIWLSDVTLSFGALGTIPMSGIDTPSALTFDVFFIRGDVDCTGTVTLNDIGFIAYYYGQLASARPEYDLNNDGIIDIYDIVTAATNFGYPL